MKVSKEINRNKKMHMFGVAEFMYNEALKYGLKPDEMYVLGLLHDVGYIYDGWKDHEKNGQKLMERLGFKDAEAIGLHGVDITEDTVLSKEAMLLIAADSCVDYEGNIGSYVSRRADIEARYDISDRDYYLDRFDRRVEYLRKHGFLY